MWVVLYNASWPSFFMAAKYNPKEKQL